MRIGDLAQAIGIDVETIRYYEKSGLLPIPAREANGYRRYGDEQLERLAFIRHCRALDMPLVDVGRLLKFLDQPAADCLDINVLVDEQLTRVRARLKSMRALEKQLTRLRERCAVPHATHECGILQDLVSAAHGEACACHSKSSGARK